MLQGGGNRTHVHSLDTASMQADGICAVLFAGHIATRAIALTRMTHRHPDIMVLTVGIAPTTSSFAGKRSIY